MVCFKKGKKKLYYFNRGTNSNHNDFYKTDLSRGKDKKGTGLGLSIVKDIITAHNEYIDVVSTEGVGTEFSFALPRTKKENWG